MSVTNYTMTTKQGRLVVCTSDADEVDYKDPDNSIVRLTFETPAGSTLTLRYRIKDGEALEDVCRSLPALLEKTLHLLVQEVAQILLGGDQ